MTITVAEMNLEMNMRIREVLFAYLPDDEEITDDLRDAYGDVSESIVEALGLEVVEVGADGVHVCRMDWNLPG